MGLLSTVSGFLPESLPKNAGSKSFYDLVAPLPKGKEYSFNELKGKPVLIVNTATRCGYTVQFTGLEELNKIYGDRGLQVLGFPSNEFAGQSPESDEEGAQVCLKNHGVTFPLMAKSEVNGKGMNEVFAWLKAQPIDGKTGSSGPIKWNFTKFLVDREGKLVGRFPSAVTPEQLKPEIEKVL
ncbi:putative GPX2-glutathione peroxidase [Kockovaella imperatae]|uniref:Glutathione peroxidase n=1 Tax=Kockovaella imperatae TaxID=4999 RepID=A0A1Y1UIY8_9TREE|nr:putative GPX2-glutathione peroxidase [Kockovaella imperatae]ORX38011.1 putative GPX2-glutathione peroxidase [Kockovaella imperatae]